MRPPPASRGCSLCLGFCLPFFLLLACVDPRSEPLDSERAGGSRGGALDSGLSGAGSADGSGARGVGTGGQGPGLADGGSAGAGGAGNGSGSSGGGASGQTCIQGATRCATSGESVELCSAGQWIKQKDCPVCAGGACTGACTPGERQCAGQTPQICSPDGQWVSEAPCADKACTGKGQCTGLCKPGNKQCGDAADKLVRYECDAAGAWIPQSPPCANLCSSGSCGGSCMPGTTRCAANDNKLEVCGPQGTWEPGAACSGRTCVEGACLGVCEPKAVQCGAGDTPQSCDEKGNWKDGEPCGNQICMKGACVGQCKPPMTKCEGTTLQTCSPSGTWTSMACQFVCNGNACGGVCKPGSKQCASGGASAQTCNPDGSGFATTASCQFGCDTGSGTCKSCQPQREDCSNGKDDDCDQKVDCQDSDCGRGDSCGSGRICNGSQCIDCRQGEDCGSDDCNTRKVECSSGARVCEVVKKSNVTCSGGRCNNGTCVRCQAADGCPGRSDPPDGCGKWVTECVGGQESCVLKSVPGKEGTICGQGSSCDNLSNVANNNRCRSGQCKLERQSCAAPTRCALEDTAVCR